MVKDCRNLAANIAESLRQLYCTSAARFTRGLFLLRENVRRKEEGGGNSGGGGGVLPIYDIERMCVSNSPPFQRHKVHTQGAEVTGQLRVNGK